MDILKIAIKCGLLYFGIFVIAIGASNPDILWVVSVGGVLVGLYVGLDS